MKLNYNSKHSRRKKYRPQKYVMPRHPVVTVLECLLSIIYTLTAVLINFHPDFESFSKKPWFIILAIVVTVGVHLFFFIIEKDRNHAGFNAAMLLAIPIYLMYIFCSVGRLYCAIATLLLPIYIGLFVVYEIHQKERKEPSDFAIALPLMVIALQVATTWFTQYVNKGTETKYLIISLVGAIIGVIICLLLLYKGILRFESVSENVLALFFTFIISIFVVFSFLSSFNYCLDRSPPEIIEAEIESKEQVGSGRNVSFFVQVDVNGKPIEFVTGFKRYSQAKVGENVNVYLYKAFSGMNITSST